MTPTLKKILGLPPLRRPSNRHWLPWLNDWLNWIFFAVFALFVLLHVFPGIVFHHKLTAHGITVHSRAPLPPAADVVLARAAALVAASELATPGRRFDLYVGDAPWDYAMFAPFRKSFAVTVPVTDNIFIARGDFTANAARSRNPEYNTRALSAVIAHEITHVLITDRIGLVDSIRLPSWVAEGYCDHVARESSFPEQEGRRLLAAGAIHPSPAYEYFVSRQLVGYLIDQRQMRFEQIATSSLQSKDLRSNVLRQMRAHQGP